MSPEDIRAELDRLAALDHFGEASAAFTARCQRDGVGIEAVVPILRFIEDNPHVEIGSPGPLVHFVERFYRRGYEDLLVESLRRRPAPHTIWMLNRLINGAADPGARELYISIMRQARTHELAGPAAREEAARFLQRLDS